MVEYLNGSAWEIPQGIMPFGNVHSFLLPSQIQKISGEAISSNYNSIIASSTCRSTFVNFVLEPKHSYEDPLNSIFNESLVERRIDKWLSCEELGLEGKDEVSSYDTERIEKFRNSIELIDGKYHVDLMWHDSVKQVQSNHNIALNVLD